MDRNYQDVQIFNYKTGIATLLLPRGVTIKKIEFSTKYIIIYYFDKDISTTTPLASLIPYEKLYRKGLLID